MEIDMTYQLKVIQQSLEQEEAEHKTTKARLADKNKIYESIEEAKSEAMKGMHCEVCYHFRVSLYFYKIMVFVYIAKYWELKGKKLSGKLYILPFFLNLCIIATVSKKLKPKCRIILPYF